MTSDESWVMADGCSLIVDGWLVMNDGWWVMSDYYELTMGGNGFKNGKWLLKVETIEWIRLGKGSEKKKKTKKVWSFAKPRGRGETFPGFFSEPFQKWCLSKEQKLLLWFSTSKATLLSCMASSLALSDPGSLSAGDGELINVINGFYGNPVFRWNFGNTNTRAF